MDEGERLAFLEKRLGRVHARMRLGIERDHRAQAFGQGLTFFHPENVPVMRTAISICLRLTGLYRRGIRNAVDVRLKRNDIRSPHLPKCFDGYTILHLSDLHADMSEAITRRVAALIGECQYDICVLTGDYRALTFGSSIAALAGMAHIRSAIKSPAFGVLGNHDSIMMLPELEGMGIRLLLNESIGIQRDDAHIYLAGLDDAHYFQADNIEKAAATIPEGHYSILLSHTPEIYRHAAHAGFHLMLAGHTHGGQICLPGGIPLTLDSHLPRRLGAGPWRYGEMAGYTSVGAGCSILPVRFNCPPEITLHRLIAVQ